MKENRYLVWAGIITMFFLSVYLITSTDKAVNDYSGASTVSFTGEGKVLAKPDVGIASLSILTDGATSKAAQDQNNKRSAAVVDFLKKNGVEEKDIRTTGYNIYPQYAYPSSRPQISSYQVNQTMEIKIRDISKVSSILDGVVTAGINQVYNLSFQVDNPEQLRAEAREKAIEDAKKKAEHLKGQLGIKLGKVIGFNETSDGAYPPIPFAGLERGGAGGGPTTPIGENEIVVQVHLTYQVK